MGDLFASVLLSGGRPHLLGNREMTRQSKMEGSMYPVPEKEQLERYAEAFYGLSKLFQKMPCQKERLGDADLELIFDRVR